MRNIAIIGGGPAGLFAAWCAAWTLRNRGTKGSVTLLERNTRCGRKLLVTGSGQCNLTRDDEAQAMLGGYGEHGRFLTHALHALDPVRTMTLFGQLGLPLVIREDKKVFPASLQASDVLRTLIQACLAQEVVFSPDSRVISMECEKDRYLLTTEHGSTCIADAVVIATGGTHYPKTGSTGDGYRLAASLGHTIVPPKPALCPLKVLDMDIGRCSGITVDPVALSDDRRKVSTGALLITRDGISGPAVLAHSRYLASQDRVHICWLPRPGGRMSTVQEVERQLAEACSRHGATKLSNVVHDLGLPINLVALLLAEAEVDGDRKAAETGKKTLLRVASMLAACTVEVSPVAKEHLAKATAGGVSLKEVDPRSMGSRLCTQVFFAGEVLDIDGDTGGYNLQAAWSTGAFAGISAAGGDPFTITRQLGTLG